MERGPDYIVPGPKRGRGRPPNHVSAQGSPSTAAMQYEDSNSSQEYIGNYQSSDMNRQRHSSGGGVVEPIDTEHFLEQNLSDDGPEPSENEAVEEKEYIEEEMKKDEIEQVSDQRKSTQQIGGYRGGGQGWWSDQDRSADHSPSPRESYSNDVSREGVGGYQNDATNLSTHARAQLPPPSPQEPSVSDAVSLGARQAYNNYDMGGGGPGYHQGLHQASHPSHHPGVGVSPHQGHPGHHQLQAQTRDPRDARHEYQGNVYPAY